MFELDPSPIIQIKEKRNEPCCINGVASNHVILNTFHKAVHSYQQWKELLSKGFESLSQSVPDRVPETVLLLALPAPDPAPRAAAARPIEPLILPGLDPIAPGGGTSNGNIRVASAYSTTPHAHASVSLPS